MDVVGKFNFSPDATRLSVSTCDGRLSIWNSASEVYQQYNPSSHLSTQITTVAWCPASQLRTPKKDKKKKDNVGTEGTADLIALGTTAGTVLLYSVTMGDVVTKLDVSLSTVRIQSISWSNSSKILFVGAEDGMVSIFSVLELELLARFKAGKEPVYSLAVTKDDKKLVTGCRSIKVWEIKSKTLLQSFTGHANEVRRLCCVEHNGIEVILSSAADDRNISVWKLDELAKKKLPAYITLSVNEYISDLDCLVVDDEILTTVTTLEGSVLIYRYSLSVARSAPIKYSSLVEIAAQGDRKVTKVHICAGISLNKDSPTLHIAYGSASALQIEELKINELKKTHLLPRSAPVLTLGAESVTEFSKIVQPRISENVKFIKTGAPSQMYGQHILENRTSGKKRKQEIDEENMTIEERLDYLKLNQSKNLDKPEAMAQLLVQGLQSKDPSILGGVLDREDEELIQRTIASLPMAFIIPLLRHIYSEVKVKGINHVSTAKWIQILVKTHIGYFISSPSVIQDILIPLNNILEQRTADYLQIKRLKQKMDILHEKMEQNKKGVRVQPERPPLLVYGSEEDEAFDEIMRGVVLEPKNHGEESEDSSDEEINGEDEMIGPEVMNGSTNGLTNGYGSSSEMDED